MTSIPKLFARAPLPALALAAAALAPSPAQAQMAFTPISPCRVWDTRSTTIHDANTSRPFAVRGRCGVPASAQAVAINVTVVLPAPPIPRDNGNLRLYPAGESAPNASLLNWTTTDSVIANGTIVKLGDDGAGGHVIVRIDMLGPAGKIHSLADVYGFFQ